MGRRSTCRRRSRERLHSGRHTAPAVASSERRPRSRTRCSRPARRCPLCSHRSSADAISIPRRRPLRALRRLPELEGLSPVADVTGELALAACSVSGSRVVRAFSWRSGLCAFVRERGTKGTKMRLVWAQATTRNPTQTDVVVVPVGTDADLKITVSAVQLRPWPFLFQVPSRCAQRALKPDCPHTVRVRSRRARAWCAAGSVELRLADDQRGERSLRERFGSFGTAGGFGAPGAGGREGSFTLARRGPAMSRRLATTL